MSGPFNLMGTAVTNDTNQDISKKTNAVNKEIADENLEFQKQKLQYDMDLQKQIFAREDTAYQRTVQDMRRAGVSPLAMQGTNGAGEIINTSAPQNSFQSQPYFNQAPDFSGLDSTINTVLNIPAQVQQARGMKLDNDFKEATLDDRRASLFADVLSKIYDISDAHRKERFNDFFGINDGMTETERRNAIYAKALGIGKNTRFDDIFHHSLKGIDFEHRKSLNYFYSDDNFPLLFSATQFGDNLLDIGKSLLGAKKGIKK